MSEEKATVAEPLTQPPIPSEYLKEAYRFNFEFVPFDEGDHIRVDNDGLLFINDNTHETNQEEIMIDVQYKRATADRLITDDQLTQASWKMDNDSYTVTNVETYTYKGAFTEFLIKNNNPASKVVLGLAANDAVLGHTKDKFLMSLRQNQEGVVIQQRRPDLEHVLKPELFN